MQFTLLGDVAGYQGDQRLRLNGKQSAVLAVLLFWPNTIVRRTEIVRLAWGALPSDTPRTIDDLIADYMSRLRTALRQAGAGGEVTLTARRPGYLLEVDEDAIDWHRFRRLMDQARTAQDASEMDDAVGLLRDGLELWKGPALADVGQTLDPIRMQMEERRLVAVENLAAIELTRGGADRVVSLLAERAVDHPGRERLVALLIQALHATGRRADAVAAYQRSRHYLAAELGLDPSKSIELAFRALLRGEQPSDPPSPPTVPAQLPLDTPNFTGRDRELAELLPLVPAQALRPGTAAGSAAGDTSTARAGVIYVVDGMAGVGKTTLAVHAAHLMTPWFPDGQLFLDLHGHTAKAPRVEPAEALERLLRSVGVAGERIPTHLDDRAALYRSRLAGKRMLIVLDDAYSAEQVRPLLPASAGCLVLVTSRRRLTALDDAHPLSLETLPAADAIALFDRVAGADRVSGQRAEVERIVALCGGLPMAIRIVAARLRNHAVWQPSQLANRLSDVQEHPRELDDGERSIAAAFTMSYEDLTGEQQRMFRLLGLVPGRDVGSHAAAALVEASPGRVTRLLQDLLDAHLLSQQREDRYRFHDLMRRFASDLAAAVDSAADRRAALTRLLDHQLRVASAAMDVLFPHERDRRPRIAASDVPIPSVSTPPSARAWLEAERVNLIAAAGWAAEHGWPSQTQHLGSILHRYLITGAHYANALELQTHALRAARSRHDRAGEATVLDHLGNAYRRVGQYEKALDNFREALAAQQEIGDRIQEAIMLTNVGIVLGLHGHYADAIDQLEQALAIDRDVGNSANEANTLTNLGNLRQFTGGYGQALDHYLHAMHIYLDIDDRAGHGIVLTNLGVVYERLGRHDLVLDHHRDALRIFAEIGDRAGEGLALTNLGGMYERQGRCDLALDYHSRALDVFRTIGHRPGQSETLSQLASVYAATQRYEEAVEHAERALDIAREIGDRTLEASIHNRLGTTLHVAGRAEAARAAHRAALALACRLGNRYEQARALEGIGEVLYAAGEQSSSLRCRREALEIYVELGVPEADRLRLQVQPPGTVG